MRHFFALLAVLCLSAALTACAAPTPIAPGSTEWEVTLVDHSIRPAQWRVPANQLLSVTVKNEDPQAHTLYVLSRSYASPWDEADRAAVIASVEVPAGESLLWLFTSPQAAGEYDVIAAPPLAEEGMVAVLLVVQPSEPLNP